MAITYEKDFYNRCGRHDVNGLFFVQEREKEYGHHYDEAGGQSSQENTTDEQLCADA